MASSPSSVPTKQFVSSQRMGACPGERGVRRGSLALRVLNSSHDPKVDCLMKSPLFRGLSPEHYHDVAQAASEMSYSSQQAIFFQDEPVQRVLLMAHGAVRISHVTEAGNETFLQIERPGDCLDDTVTPSQIHSVCARAAEDSILLSWDVNTFEELSVRIPAINRNIIRIMSLRLQTLHDRLCDVSTRPAPQRLARLILQLDREAETSHAIVSRSLARTWPR